MVLHTFTLSLGLMSPARPLPFDLVHQHRLILLSVSARVPDLLIRRFRPGVRACPPGGSPLSEPARVARGQPDQGQGLTVYPSDWLDADELRLSDGAASGLNGNGLEL